MDRFKFYVVGYYRKSGTYQDKPYDNWYLVCEVLHPGTSYQEITGKVTRILKISSRRFDRVMNGKTLNDVFNHKCNIVYDQYDVVTDLEVID